MVRVVEETRVVETTWVTVLGGRVEVMVVPGCTDTEMEVVTTVFV